MTENTNVHYKCAVDDVIEGIASKGVRFIKPPKFSSELLQETTWKLDKLLAKQNPIELPSTGQTFMNLNGELSVIFGNYNDHRVESSSGSVMETDSIDNERDLMDLDLPYTCNKLVGQWVHRDGTYMTVLEIHTMFSNKRCLVWNSKQKTS